MEQVQVQEQAPEPEVVPDREPVRPGRTEKVPVKAMA